MSLNITSTFFNFTICTWKSLKQTAAKGNLYKFQKKKQDDGKRKIGTAEKCKEISSKMLAHSKRKAIAF